MQNLMSQLHFQRRKTESKSKKKLSELPRTEILQPQPADLKFPNAAELAAMSEELCPYIEDFERPETPLANLTER